MSAILSPYLTWAFLSFKNTGRCCMKKGDLRNFAKFTGKHLRQSLFFNKVAGPCNFIKKKTVTQVFFREFYKISKTTFFTEHLWTTASEIQHKIISVGDHWLFYSHPVFHDIWRLRHKSSRKEVYQNFSIFITISAIISSNFYIHLKP